MAKAAPSREVWVPRLSFMNSLEETKIVSHADIFADDDGNMFQGLDFTGKFSTIFNLRRFPFDSQILPIRIQPTDADKNEMNLDARPVSERRARRGVPVGLGRGKLRGSLGGFSLSLGRIDLFDVCARDTGFIGARPITCIASFCL